MLSMSKEPLPGVRALLYIQLVSTLSFSVLYSTLVLYMQSNSVWLSVQPTALWAFL